MTDERKPKNSVHDPYEGLDDIAGELGFPERASGWPDAGSRENLPRPSKHTHQGAGPNQGARES